MATTSFIKPMDNDKGIFYTFQSARDDMSRTFNKNFKFSKFLLVKIPEMGIPDDLEKGEDSINKLQFLAAGESPLINGISSTDYNFNLSESFQNYCLNVEALLINQSTYNPNLSRTVAERVFWKWIKEMGGLRFRETTGDENDPEKDYSVLGDEKRFVEKDEFNFTDTEPTRVYNRVVKYVGEVGMTNSIKGQNSYTEIYVHVPTWVGNTPYTLFASVEDDNYFPDMTIINSGAANEDIEYLAGRKSTDTHPFGLSTLAYYDLDDAGAVDPYISASDLTVTPTNPGRWFTESTNNANYTDDQYLDGSNNWVGTGFDNAHNARIKRDLVSDAGATNVELIRNSLDGIIVDWDLNNYKLANENSDIQSFADFSAYINSTDFEYNAILLYYDILNPTTGEVLSTNLYGIQFLNQVKLGTYDWSIPTTKKYMPDPVNLINGNSFAYKFNIKFDAYNGSIDVEKSVNDYNTFSMDLYLDVLNASKTLSERYAENLAYISNVKQEIDELKRLFIDDTNKDELMIRITKLEDSYIQSQALFENTDTVMKLITDLYDKIDAIDSNITYNVTEYNTLNLGQTPEYDFILNQSLALGKGNNYIRSVSLQTGIDVTTLTGKIRIIIDDTQKWVRGQSFEVVFTGAINPDIYSIEFVTDTRNMVGSGQYGIVVANITSSMLDVEFNGHYNFVCYNQDKLLFYVDKIN